MNILSKHGAYVRGLLLVANAVMAPLSTKIATGGAITRGDLIPAVIAGFTTWQAFLNQSNATTESEKRLKVWLSGGGYVLVAMLGALEKPFVTGQPITQAHAVSAFVAGGTALMAFMSKALTLADVVHPFADQLLPDASEHIAQGIAKVAKARTPRKVKPPLGDRLKAAAGAFVGSEAGDKKEGVSVD